MTKQLIKDPHDKSDFMAIVVTPTEDDGTYDASTVQVESRCRSRASLVHLLISSLKSVKGIAERAKDIPLIAATSAMLDFVDEQILKGKAEYTNVFTGEVDEEEKPN